VLIAWISKLGQSGQWLEAFAAACDLVHPSAYPRAQYGASALISAVSWERAPATARSGGGVAAGAAEEEEARLFRDEIAELSISMLDTCAPATALRAPLHRRLIASDGFEFRHRLRVSSPAASFVIGCEFRHRLRVSSLLRYVRLHFEVEHGKPPPPVAEYFAAPSRAPAPADDVSVSAASHDDEALSSPDEAERRAGRDPDEAERRAGRNEPPADAAEAATVASDPPETTPGAPYRAQVNFGALASVCLELCVNVGRLDHLLGPIYTLFCTSSRSREAYLLALEPFIVTRRVPSLPGALLLNMARLFALPPCDPGSAAALTGHVGASSWALTGHPSAVASASGGEPGVVGGWEHCLIATDCD
jgi:hypothetical protein